MVFKMNEKADRITDVINEALDECESVTQRIMLLSYIQSIIAYVLKDFVKMAYDNMENEDEVS